MPGKKRRKTQTGVSRVNTVFIDGKNDQLLVSKTTKSLSHVYLPDANFRCNSMITSDELENDAQKGKPKTPSLLDDMNKDPGNGTHNIVRPLRSV